MQAARLAAVGSMRIEQVAVPRPGPGELLVRVEACGICGSDRHMFRGEYPTALPVTLGHEFCGMVEATGPDVSGFSVGTRITGDPNIACGHCARCAEGRPNLCDSLTAIGVFRDGGFADYVVVPTQQAHILPSDLDPVHGAFCEPIACCLHGLDVARIAPGASVAILGGGVIGLLMVELARLAGAGTIVLSTRQAQRRALAEAVGATHTVDASRPDATELICGPSGIAPGGVDVVLECAGVPETFAQSIAISRRGGAVVVFGVTPKGATISVEPFDILVRELRIESAWLNPLTHARAAELVSAGTLDLDSLVTRVVPLSDVPKLIAAAPATGEVKLIARP